MRLIPIALLAMVTWSSCVPPQPPPIPDEPDLPPVPTNGVPDEPTEPTEPSEEYPPLPPDLPDWVSGHGDGILYKPESNLILGHGAMVRYPVPGSHAVHHVVIAADALGAMPLQHHTWPRNTHRDGAGNLINAELPWDTEAEPDPASPDWTHNGRPKYRGMNAGNLTNVYAVFYGADGARLWTKLIRAGWMRQE